MQNENAFSGIEAAIVMIAFVVVAAIFAFVMMQTGFFATQKFQTVTYSGIKQSTSTLITDGLIRGQYSEAGGGLQSLTFSIHIPDASQAVDLSEMIYYYSRDTESGSTIPLSYVTPSSGIIRSGDTIRIRIDLAGAGMAGPRGGGSFTLEVKPPVGASILIHRTLPAVYEGGYIS